MRKTVLIIQHFRPSDNWETNNHPTQSHISVSPQNLHQIQNQQTESDPESPDKSDSNAFSSKGSSLSPVDSLTKSSRSDGLTRSERAEFSRVPDDGLDISTHEFSGTQIHGAMRLHKSSNEMSESLYIEELNKLKKKHDVMITSISADDFGMISGGDDFLEASKSDELSESLDKEEFTTPNAFSSKGSSSSPVNNLTRSERADFSRVPDDGPNIPTKEFSGTQIHGEQSCNEMSESLYKEELSKLKKNHHVMITSMSPNDFGMISEGEDILDFKSDLDCLVQESVDEQFVSNSDDNFMVPNRGDECSSSMNGDNCLVSNNDADDTVIPVMGAISSVSGGTSSTGESASLDNE